MKKLFEKIRGLLQVKQETVGHHSVQIGHVTGNVTVLTSPADNTAERDAVKQLVRRVPWAPVCRFMDKTFNTRQVDALDKHQLYRLRRYVETMIASGNVKRQKEAVE